MNEQILKELEERTKTFILNAYQTGNLDLDSIDDVSIWYAGNSTLAIPKPDMSSYARSYYAYISEFVENVLKQPECFVFPMGETCVSVAGTVEFGTDVEGIEVSFQINWVLVNEKWVVKQLITSIYDLAERKDFWHDDTRLNYKLINASLPIGIMCCDVKGNHDVKMINEILAELLGYDSLGDYKRSVGSSALAALHSDDIPAFREFVEEIKANGVADSQEFRVRRKDYTYSWMQFHGSMIHGTWLLFTCTDHGELKERLEDMEKSEEEADAKQEFFSSMINYLPGGFHRCTLYDPVHMEYVSDTLCEMTGYTRKEIMEDMHANYSMLVEEEDHPVLFETIKSLMGYPHATKLEYRLKRKNAPSIWATEITRSIRHPDGNMHAYAIVFDTDEEHRKRQHIGELAEQMHIGYALYEHDGISMQAVYLNPALAEMAGYEPQDNEMLLRQGSYSLVHEAERKIVFEKILQAESTGEPASCKVHLNGKEGKLVPVILNISAEREADGKHIVSIYVFGGEAHEVALPGDNAASTSDERRVEIRTFGYFEVYVDGQPIHFRTEKAREMLAVMVDRRGGYVPRGSMIGMLWEDEWENKTTLARCRKVYKSLVDELKKYGVEDIVESTNGTRRIIPEKVNCDYFDYRSGDPQYKNLFKGSYMTEYSWAEVTLSELMNDLERN